MVAPDGSMTDGLYSSHFSVCARFARTVGETPTRATPGREPLPGCTVGAAAIRELHVQRARNLAAGETAAPLAIVGCEVTSDLATFQSFFGLTEDGSPMSVER